MSTARMHSATFAGVCLPSHSITSAAAAGSWALSWGDEPADCNMRPFAVIMSWLKSWEEKSPRGAELEFRCSALCWILHGICPLSLLFRPAAPPLVVPPRELRRRSMCRRGFPSFCGLGRGCDVWLWTRCSSSVSCRGRCPSSCSSSRSIGLPWGRGVWPVSVALPSPFPCLCPLPCRCSWPLGRMQVPPTLLVACWGCASMLLLLPVPLPLLRRTPPNHRLSVGKVIVLTFPCPVCLAGTRRTSYPLLDLRRPAARAMRAATR